MAEPCPVYVYGPGGTVNPQIAIPAVDEELGRRRREQDTARRSQRRDPQPPATYSGPCRCGAIVAALVAGDPPPFKCRPSHMPKYSAAQLTLATGGSA